MEDSIHSAPSFTCGECGMHFGDRDTAQKCEAWCREHYSCNLEITRHSFERIQKDKPPNK